MQTQITSLSRQLRAWAVLGAALVPPPAHPTLRLPELELGPASRGSVVVLGERHRNPPSHRLFLDLVEHAVARGDRVLVGLEIPSDRQNALDAGLLGKRSLDGLAHPIIDCPSYRWLLAGLGRLVRGADGRLTVKALDAPRGETRSREVAMFQEILAAARESSYDRVLVLVGNLHALKEVPWSLAAAAAGPRLAGLLAAAGPPVTSVLQTFEGECADAAEGVFYGSGEPAVAVQVASLWQGLNTVPPPPGLAERAADGVVVWRCVP